ncbi:hypothetical protein BsWGS_16913 [Bradybaena similaris]
MTPPLQPHLSTSLRLQLLLLATVGYKSAWSHSFNFTLMFVSCDSELLQNVDDIAIVGVIDTQGHGQRDTVYSLLVESTFDNQSFVHICSTEFKSSDCVNSTSYGCYCREAVDGGNRLHVVIRQRADQTTATHYRLRINSKDSKNETWIFVPVPSIYAVVNDTTYFLRKNGTCTVSSRLSRDSNIKFCTRNLKSSLSVLSGEKDITYYISLECVLHNITERTDGSGKSLSFQYTDSCNRSNTFTCYEEDNVKTVTQVVSLEATPRVIPIVIGSLLSLFFFVTVVIYLCDGIQVRAAKGFPGQEVDGISGFSVQRQSGHANQHVHQYKLRPALPPA